MGFQELSGIKPLPAGRLKWGPRQGCCRCFGICRTEEAQTGRGVCYEPKRSIGFEGQDWCTRGSAEEVSVPAAVMVQPEANLASGSGGASSSASVAVLDPGLFVPQTRDWQSKRLSKYQTWWTSGWGGACKTGQNWGRQDAEDQCNQTWIWKPVDSSETQVQWVLHHGWLHHRLERWGGLQFWRRWVVEWRRWDQFLRCPRGALVRPSHG